MNPKTTGAPRKLAVVPVVRTWGTYCGNLEFCPFLGRIRDPKRANGERPHCWLFHADLESSEMMRVPLRTKACVDADKAASNDHEHAATRPARLALVASRADIERPSTIEAPLAFTEIDP